MNEAFQNQEKLQSEAKQVLKELEILSVLSTLGESQIIGSVALEVMTRKDIDIEIITENVSKQDIADIVKLLAAKPLPRIDFTVMDNGKGESENLPKGIYIGIKYAGKDKLIEKYRDNPMVWQIDCWFVDKENARGSKTTNEIKQKLTSDLRQTILEIKYELANNADYKGRYLGIDIYKAVIEKNLKTTEDFINSLDTL